MKNLQKYTKDKINIRIIYIKKFTEQTIKEYNEKNKLKNNKK